MILRGWTYYSRDGGQLVSIGREWKPIPRDPHLGAVLLQDIWTDDPEEAEEWRQALVKGEIPNHNPTASRRAELRWAHRELGMSREALAQRFRREPGMAQLVKDMWSELEVVDQCGCGLASSRCLCAQNAAMETEMEPSSAGSGE